jgi:hypothetical protein
MIWFTKCIKKKLELISNLIISKHVSPIEATLICLKMPIVQKSQSVKYIDTKPLLFCMKLVTKSKIIGSHPIDIYISRLIAIEKLTFM